MTPGGDGPDLSRPSAAEARGIVGAVAAAAAPADGLTPLQVVLLESLVLSMTDHAVRVADTAPLSAAELGDLLARRTPAFRDRILQTVLLVALVLHPMPPTVVAKVREYAGALGVDDEMLEVAAAFADGALDLAAADFDRNGYLAAVDPERMRALHVEALAQPWAAVDHDPALAARWASLEELPVGTLGRGVADFYRDRGFVYPGLPGAAPPLLTQHDWVHVLADYGTTLENELEVFAFMARANDDPRGFSLLAMIVSLFETGQLAAGAGLFLADGGHLSTPGAAPRLADAMRRGALLDGSHDFLGTDWFAVADRPLHVLRDELRVPPKRLPDGVVSPGPWDDGGITPFQLRAAADLARSRGEDPVPWRPDPSRQT